MTETDGVSMEMPQEGVFLPDDAFSPREMVTLIDVSGAPFNVPSRGIGSPIEPEPLITFSRFDSTTDATAKLVSTDWDRFRDWLRQSSELARKEDGSLFSPATFDTDDRKASSDTREFWRGQRKKGNVLELCALVLDLEDKAGKTGFLTPEEWLNEFPSAIWDYEFVAYSTHGNREGQPRFRVVVPLVFPFCVDWMRELGCEWEHAYRAAAYRLTGGTPFDESCAEAARMFYLPSHPPGSEPWSVYNTGQFLTPNEVVAWGLELAATEQRAQVEALAQVEARKRRVQSGEKRPGDAYNEETDFLKTLLGDGWTIHQKLTDRLQLTRPGKEMRDGASATFWLDSSHLYNFSASVPHLDANRLYDALGYLAAAQFGGDFAACTRFLGAQGYGDRFTPPVERDSPVRGAPPASPLIKDARTLQELVLPDPRWAVPDFIPEGVTILGGGQKLGKSWLCLNIGVAVATGGYALGSIQVEQGDALYLALEDTDKRLQSRLRSMLGCSEWPDRFFYATEWPLLGAGCEEELCRWLESHPEARLVFVDTFKKVRPARRMGANTYDEDYSEVSRLKRVADEFGVAVVVVTHVRKAPADDPFDRITSSMAVTGAADASLVLDRERGSQTASLWVTGRDITEEREDALLWHPETVSWSLEGRAESVKQSNVRREMTDHLQREARPCAPQEIADALNWKPATVRSLLRRMLGAQEIAKVGDRYCDLATARQNGAMEGSAFDAGNLPRTTDDEGDEE